VPRQELKAVALQDRRDHGPDDGLPEALADADARAPTERHVRPAWQCGLAFRGHPVRSEYVRFVEDLGQVMRGPRGVVDVAAGRDVLACELEARGSPAGPDPDRRLDSQRLVDGLLEPPEHLSGEMLGGRRPAS
jgi:hypothetical protein